MSDGHRVKPASQQESSLYLFLGESVCAIQHLEDALCHSIALKGSRPKTRMDADLILKNYQSHTLGRAIKVAKKSNLYSESILNGLDDLLAERNWLIHKSISHGRDEWDLDIGREKLFERIKSITKKSLVNMRLIEEDLILFSEANGVDMSRVKSEIKRNYTE